MTFRKAMCVTAVAAVLGLVIAATGNAQSLKDKLETRYKNQRVVLLLPNTLVAPFTESGLFRITDTDFNVHYDHFHPALELPDRYKKRATLDDRTTEYVDSTTSVTAKLDPGEALEVMRIAQFKRGRDAYMVDFMLKALSERNRLARVEKFDSAGNSLGSPKKVPFGVHVRFAFPISLIESGEYDAVEKEINAYLLPLAEYQEQQRTATERTQAQRNVSLQPGMSRAEVIEALGEPVKSVVFGSKTILTFSEITVDLENDKVTDVKVN